MVPAKAQVCWLVGKVAGFPLEAIKAREFTAIVWLRMAFIAIIELALAH